MDNTFHMMSALVTLYKSRDVYPRAFRETLLIFFVFDCRQDLSKKIERSRLKQFAMEEELRVWRENMENYHRMVSWLFFMAMCLVKNENKL